MRKGTARVVTGAAVLLGMLAAVVWSAASRSSASGLVSAADSAPFAVAQTAQVERGKGVFRAKCEKCHGAEGQGGDEAPRLIGAPNPITGYKTARDLFEFLSTQMPIDEPGTLKPEEYWDVLAFVLDANKLLPPGLILGPENAGNILLSP